MTALIYVDGCILFQGHMKKVLQGVVVSNKMQRTVVVKVNRVVSHSKYRKKMIISKRFKAETGNDSYQIGDIVEIEETRPLSKDKRWTVKKLVKGINVENIESERNDAPQKRTEGQV